MSTDPLRPPEPAAGYHRITSERRFRYLQQDPEHTVRVTWQALPVTCPVCATDTGLTLTYEQGVDQMVHVLCPQGHAWPEPLVDTGHFTTYSRLEYWLDPHPDMLWIIDEGFGQEPPPPVDYAADLAAAAKDVRRRTKARIKGAIRRPVRRAKKKALNLAFTPVAAALRGAWAQQAGGVADTEPKAPGRRRGKKAAEKGPKVPSYAKYRKAYGIPAPAKGPRCLVCRDTGRITAPGVSIPCTECRPATEALAAAERRAERARAGKGPRRS
ncbi:hypothetical protein ACH4PU_30595 [Streptomyces sp. NPDC021100]|uniref:hypothetical protein n=1 Tax=Streptomyces sp. NPDC021100 TaxID=3365114 RepID=UPI00378BD6E1